MLNMEHPNQLIDLFCFFFVDDDDDYKKKQNLIN